LGLGFEPALEPEPGCSPVPAPVVDEYLVGAGVAVLVAGFGVFVVGVVVIPGDGGGGE